MGQKKYKKGDKVVVKVSERMASRYPALADSMGSTEEFTIVSVGKKTPGYQAVLRAHEMVQLRVADEDIVDWVDRWADE